jgi:hypothetical protein
MLQAEDCRLRAEECARRAEATMIPDLRKRYRHLELSWRYLVRLKLKRREDEARLPHSG